MSIPKSYRTQGGCHDCQHVFIKSEYDSGMEYFCTLDAPERPPCGSVAMQEPREDEPRNEFWNAWDEWRSGRGVSSCGICDNWIEDKTF